LLMAYLTTTPPSSASQLQPSTLKPLKPSTFHFSLFTFTPIPLPNSASRLPTSGIKFDSPAVASHPLRQVSSFPSTPHPAPVNLRQWSADCSGQALCNHLTLLTF
jgi:hypothetical protein